MEKRPGLILIGLFLVFAIAIFVAWRIGGSRATATDAPAAPVKKFRAEPGTMRENARAIVSDVPSAESDAPKSNSSKSSPKEIDTWTKPKEPTVTEQVTQEVGQLLDEALHARSISEGVAHIRERIDNSASPEGRSQLYSSLGTLQARTGDTEAMNQSFAMAQRISLSEAERVEAVYRHTRALLELDQPDAVLAAIDGARLDELETSSRLLQIRVAEAIAHDKLGNKTSAAKGFESVVLNARQAKREGRPDIDSVMRLAALRAQRLYEELQDKAGIVRVRRAMTDV